MPLVRIAEAARQLGCCPTTIRRLERDGLFTSTRDRAGARRFSAEDIEALRRILFTSGAKRAAETSTDTAAA